MRTAGETLGTQGVSHSATIVAALRWVYRYEQGLMRERHLPLANDELVDMLPKHPEIVHSFPVAAKAHKLAAPSLVTALHYLCSQRDKATADEFFDKFAHGYGLKAGHVVLVLRRRLWREAYKRHAVVRDDHKALMIVNAWNIIRKRGWVRIPWTQPLARGGQTFPEIL